MQAKTYEQALALAETIFSISIYYQNARNQLDHLRKQRIIELANSARSAAVRHDCDVWGRLFAEMEQLARDSQQLAEIRKEGCSPPTIMPGSNGNSPPTLKTNGGITEMSQAELLLQKAESAFARKNYAVALDITRNGLLNSLSSAGRAKRNVIRGKAACYLINTNRTNNPQDRGVIAEQLNEVRTAESQLLQMGNQYESQFADFKNACNNLDVKVN